MSRRTSESSRAIRLAWKKEQELVEQGKGTRDWTSKQQEDILEKGRAYDDYGRAFEGQHMKSAEKYPEFQGNPNNIQFLTKEEHLKAHDGDWKNPTNWYYDPISNQKTEFGDGTVIPCKAIDLKSPLVKSTSNNPITKESNISTEKEMVNIKEKIDKSDSISSSAITKSNKKIRPKIVSGFKSMSNKIANFAEKHPVLIEAILQGSELFGRYAAIGGISKFSNKISGSNYKSSKNTPNRNTGNNSASHSSPKEHTVPAHSQLYHTKDGPIIKNKAPYSRGGKK